MSQNITGYMRYLPSDPKLVHEEPKAICAAALEQALAARMASRDEAAERAALARRRDISVAKFKEKFGKDRKIETSSFLK